MPTFLSIVVSLFYSAVIAGILGFAFMDMAPPEVGLAAVGGFFFAIVVSFPILFVTIFLVLKYLKKRFEPKKFMSTLFGLTILFAILVLGATFYG